MDKIIIYDTIDSTNAEARRLLTQGPVPHGLMICTTEQTAGKGQQNRVWLTSPGKHLAMTLILRPKDAFAPALPALNMQISLAIVRAILQVEPTIEVRIKWPNDLYVGSKKLCGQLIENVLSGGRIQHTIIGIGLNVNESLFPPELPNAISLHQLTGKLYELEEVAKVIQREVMDMVEFPLANWKEDYDQFTFGLHETHRFQIGEQVITASVSGVDDQGRLILQHEGGESKAYFSHEIKWILP